jgi:hypothetical protein
MTRVAVIAGTGALPHALAARLDRPLVAALEGFLPDGPPPDLTFRLERLVPFLHRLREQGVAAVTLAGGVRRPRLDPALFDPATAALLPLLLPALEGGDDAALRALIGVIEAEGLAVLGLAAIAPDLLAAEGVAGSRAPGAREAADAARGAAILAALAAADVGQACVVAEGLCLGVEAAYGTDALLAFVAAHRPTLHPALGGVLVKRAKAGQDLRVDLPAVGPATVAAAVAAGLTGICVQAGATVILDRPAVLTAAAAAGLALWAVP